MVATNNVHKTSKIQAAGNPIISLLYVHLALTAVSILIPITIIMGERLGDNKKLGFIIAVVV